jgi:DNA replication protein DnaC
MMNRLQIVDAVPDRCSVCSGTGFEHVGEGVRPCECVRVKRLEKALANSRIPDRFRDCTFENYVVASRSLQLAVMESRRFVQDAPDTEMGLLYLGSCGLGKTHLATAALTLLIRKGLSGLFYDFRDLLKEIQDTYNPKTQASEMQVLAPVLNADVLVLDELGAAKPTAWVQETITHVINTRYNEKRLTVFTSNYLDTAGGGYDETLTERVGVRLRSRLHEMCRLVPMEGEDYRLKIRNRKAGKAT